MNLFSKSATSLLASSSNILSVFSKTVEKLQELDAQAIQKRKENDLQVKRIEEQAQKRITELNAESSSLDTMRENHASIISNINQILNK